MQTLEVPRNDRESSFATFWQLSVLEVVARSDSWTSAESELGLDKHQIQRLVTRLAAKLKIDRGLLVELEGRPHVPMEYDGLVDEARDVLFKYKAIEEKASLDRRIFLIRIDGYWSHIEQFLGEALGRFETAHEEIKVELAPWFGRRRDGGGTGLLVELNERKVDLVIAPWDPALAPIHNDPDRDAADGLAVLWNPMDEADAKETRPLRFLPAYRWALAAALRDRHPLYKDVEDGQLDVEVLARRDPSHRIVAAPPGHASRILLEQQQTPSRRFAVATTSPEPAALVALGSASDRVPIIPTDSEVDWRPKWPVLVTRGFTGPDEPKVLAGTFAIYWREHAQPSGMIEPLRRFAEKVAVAASRLDPGAEGWGACQILEPGPSSQDWEALAEICTSAR